MPIELESDVPHVSERDPNCVNKKELVSNGLGRMDSEIDDGGIFRVSESGIIHQQANHGWNQIISMLLHT